MLKIKSLCAFCVLLAAPYVAAEELSETGQFIDGVAAVVNEGVVLKSQYYDQLEMIMERASEQKIPLPPADILQEQVLERVVLTEIQLQRADRIGLQISDQMLNSVLADVAVRMGGTLADLPTMLAAENIDYQTFRRQMREDVTLEQLRRIDVEQRIEVSPREIEQCIADLETNVVVNSEYDLSHILLTLPEAASSSEIDEKLATANEIVARARDGADFRQLAARYSQGPTALEGGALGWMKGEAVPTVFTDILTPLSAGDVSDPYRTANSVHIVKINDMRSAVERSEIKQVSSRHILISPDEIIDDETAKQQLEDAYERIKNGEDFAELAKLLSDDPGSANSGGELGWVGPGTFAPEFEAALDTLEIGGLSEPFRTQFGWHIVEVLDRRVYDNTEDLKEQNCVVRIRAGKRDDETQLWMRRLRDEAYVDVRM
ncbi:MAG: peptidylprolyl isomerase [Gammaproteobacteria bacterium]|nr:peptidylprolyl isomerase [Gammaproteobacteria bacterium]